MKRTEAQLKKLPITKLNAITSSHQELEIDDVRIDKSLQEFLKTLNIERLGLECDTLEVTLEDNYLSPANLRRILKATGSSFAGIFASSNTYHPLDIFIRIDYWSRYIDS